MSTVPEGAGPERSAVEFGGTRIDYVVRRSQRRKVVSVAVDPAQGVVVAAPETTPLERLDEIVRSKGLWILRKQRVRDAAADETVVPTRPQAFVSGETFQYLGRGYRLEITTTDRRRTSVSLRGRRLHVELPSDTPEEARAAAVREALVEWYAGRAERALEEAVARWSPRLRASAAVVPLREPAKRWGSCNVRGTLRLNWRIVQGSRRLLDYVVAHELNHVRHRKHDAEFWASLARVMPDFDERREELRRVGPAFMW